MGIRLKIWVDPKAAILAGKAVIRDQLVELDEQFVSSLSHEQRQELVHLVMDEGEVLGRFFKVAGATMKPDTKLCDASLEEIRRGLSYRVTTREEHDNARKYEAERLAEEQRGQAEILSRLPIDKLIIASEEGWPRLSADLEQERNNPFCTDLYVNTAAELERRRQVLRARDQEKAAAEKHEEEKKITARKLAIYKWIEKNGDDSQKSRWKEGLMPEQEVLKNIRDDLFGDLEPYDRYKRLLAEDICSCECVTDVAFLADDHVSLSAEQFSTLEQLREDVPKGGKVEVRRHHGSCPSCECEHVTRYSALVSVEWNGFALSREYSLGEG